CVFARPAGAQPATLPHPVLLAVDSCTGVEPSEVVRVLQIELDTPVLPAESRLGQPLLTGEEPPTPETQGATRVSVQCAAEKIRIEVWDPDTKSARTRTLDLSDQSPLGRPRLLALAISELIASAPPNQSAHPVPPPPSEPKGSAHPRTASEKRQSPPRQPVRKQRARALVAAGGSLEGTPPVLALNLALAAEAPVPGAPVRVGIGVEATAFGSKRVPLGSVEIWRLGGFAFAGFSLRIGSAHFEPFAGASLSQGWLVGKVNDARSTKAGENLGVTYGPLLGTWLSTHVEPLELCANVRGGWMLRSVGAIVGDRREYSMSGPWLAAGIGVGYEL
ncbi:MAG TPA: hypothetical protein VGJ84_15110, partial [Polyangiaceae bacterium]